MRSPPPFYTRNAHLIPCTTPCQSSCTPCFYVQRSLGRDENQHSMDLLAPTPSAARYGQLSLIDLNAKPERIGCLAASPQLETKPLDVVAQVEAAGVDP